MAKFESGPPKPKVKILWPLCYASPPLTTSWDNLPFQQHTRVDLTASKNKWVPNVNATHEDVNNYNSWAI
jgi:hypothetical protein